jgi:membrane-associated phospholipid phosphatase
MSRGKEFSLPGKERLKAILIYGNLSTLVFTLVYGICNYLAAQGTEVYAMYSEWETQIPLIPWMIYPYISLNLLFVLNVFILNSAQSIKALCYCLISGVLIAGIFFYFFPGQLGFNREVPLGYESIFEFMFSIDHPHNLFPSLHITYSAISIWAMQEHFSNKFLRWLFDLWFLTISFSVVLVHQHHLFDVFTGYLLAIFLFRYVYLKVYQGPYHTSFIFGLNFWPGKYLQKLKG